MRAFRTMFTLLSIGMSPTLIYAVLLPSTPAAISTMPGEPGELTLPFTVTSDTQIPGKLLKPGSYTLRIVDHLRDRVVLRIENGSGKSESLFLGLPNTALGSEAGPVSWGKAGKHPALRGFVFPGGSAVEFVYEKEQAVEIATATAMKVPAIDPASEGMKANGDLSREDMSIITLWKLSPTRVGPQQGILAQRVTPPLASPHTEPVQTAQVSSAAALPPVPPVASRPTQTKRSASGSSVQMAALHRPVFNALPHTGSDMPAILLAGIILTGAAGSLRFTRLRRA